MRAWRAAVCLSGAVALLAGAGCRDGVEPAPQGPTPVRAIRAGRESISDRILLSGRAVPPADRDASLSPLVAGKIASVRAREGTQAVKGQVLAQIDTAPFDDTLAAAQAAERSAVAEMEFRQREAERTKALMERGVTSRQDAEADAAAAVAAQSARVAAASASAEAKRRRGWATLTAPFDGVVLRVFRGAGDLVDGTPATPVLELAATSPIEIAADATAPILGRIAPSNAAEITRPGSQEAPLSARVLRVARAVSSAAGVGEVRLSLDSQTDSLLLGTAVEVRIVVSKKEQALVVPVHALRRAGDGSAEVVLVEGGKAHARAVQTGIIDGDRIEITSGLTGGEQVVVDDPLGLADGTELSVHP